jgi:hypothetical protein
MKRKYFQVLEVDFEVDFVVDFVAHFVAHFVAVALTEMGKVLG